ncbi:PQQ-dependent dehydrogenase, methanol/ethanol family [Parahaliea maris]|uniref:PQQ-dependent dehydrogenase, methanol/ethanol family n=1 Tax=Parahaliea maris TaxID=2716870 RepID=A0A5C9AA40_9GAMM|nr:PQQ-dependent dehydrogenase, methanol/ethanol family [Parahaliea maris]TXS96467.1 PQQ-dependent dehydrogenase, methanol/ethanol family [Parahaliea maris]
MRIIRVCLAMFLIPLVLTLQSCKSFDTSDFAEENSLADARVHQPKIPLAAVDASTVPQLELDPGNWWSHGRTWSEQRFSPLDSINTSTVSRLGLAWQADLQSHRFGIEASPIVVNGKMYVSSSWGRVFAFDARTGKKLWMYDPKVPGAWARQGCCKPVNRGVAVWKGKVFVGAYDGRLIAIDGTTGKEIWSANTTDSKPWLTITGAPRVVNGKVIIGNGGGDYGTRGFFSAYSAESGELLWRFYVVPGDPANGFEHPEMEMAMETWNQDRDWSVGGGGNPWDSFAFDPELNLLYVGTGNGGPFGSWNPAGGDGLFLSSILAINPDNGRLAWHYQTTPGESWDFTATQHMILADLEIEGRRRKVLMQAPKNGFFYVLDRETGELISADNYAYVNWAEGIDMTTGRPILTEEANFENQARLIFPSAYGGHNWPPMAWSPETRLVYIPAREYGFVWGSDRITWFMTGHDVSTLTDRDLEGKLYGQLLAWDPVLQRAAWTVKFDTLTNGGVLATAGDLVINGSEDGYLRFFNAKNGEQLHEIFFGTGIIAPPISYSVGDEQYIALGVGWNGPKAEPLGPDTTSKYSNAGRLVVLKLDGSEVEPADKIQLQPFMRDDKPQDADLIAEGVARYQQHCAICHGVVGEDTVVPDLRRMSQGVFDAFDLIVLQGLMEAGGMASFGDVLDTEDTKAIRAYLVDWAQRSRKGDQRPFPYDAESQKKVPKLSVPGA